MLPPTSRRVRRNTADQINEQIRRQTERNVTRFAGADAVAISRRLDELDREWDIERCLETVAPTLTLLGTALGLTHAKRWFLVPVVVQGFFLQHALQGWCPPIPVLRRLGIRTTSEIDEERQALKAMRGDFDQVVSDDPDGFRRSEEAIRAARK